MQYFGRPPEQVSCPRLPSSRPCGVIRNHCIISRHTRDIERAGHRFLTVRPHAESLRVGITHRLPASLAHRRGTSGICLVVVSSQRAGYGVRPVSLSSSTTNRKPRRSHSVMVLM